MSYVKFENCIVDFENISRSSFPKESNLKLAFVQQLYNNELQRGKTESANRILPMLMECERNFYKDVVFSRKAYFKEIRKEQFGKYLLKFLKSCINKWIWGNGIRIARMTATMIVVAALFSVIYFFTVFANGQDVMSRIGDAVILSCSSFFMSNLDIVEITEFYQKIFILVQNGLGMLYLALLTSAICRKVVR